MVTNTRVAVRDSETDFPGLHTSWQASRTEAHARFWQDTRIRLRLPYHCTAEQAARIESDALYLARCDNWAAANPAPFRA